MQVLVKYDSSDKDNWRHSRQWDRDCFVLQLTLDELGLTQEKTKFPNETSDEARGELICMTGL